MTSGSRRTSGNRIAVLSPSLAGQGAERKALYLAAGLLARGHEVDLLLERLICHYSEELPHQARIFFSSDRSDARTRRNMGRLPRAPRPLVPSPPPWRVRYPRIGMALSLRANQLPLLASTRLPRWAAGVAAYLDREQPDALLAMNVLAATSTAMATRLAHHSVRTVVTLHEPLKRGRQRRRASRSYPYADVVVGVSRGVSTEFERIPGLDHDRTHVVYNPVVSEYVERRSREPANHSWVDSPDRPVVLAVGKLIKRKDFDVLLTAFARLAAHRSARLIVLGEGRMRPKLLALAKALKVEKHVDFPGFNENPYAFFAKVDLFVLSSRNEALPTVLIEAMACGCPVVSTDCPYGPREVLEEGRLGALVPVGDAESLAMAMDRALENPPRPDALRSRASFFSVDRAVERYEELLLG